jgi:opacity protein-like surface antigen
MDWNFRLTCLSRISKLLACWPVASVRSTDTPHVPAAQPLAAMINTTVLVMISSMLSPAPALAGEPYIGAEAGYSYSDLHNVAISFNGARTSLGGPVNGESRRLFAGYSFTPYVAIEGGWFKSNDLRGTIGGFPLSETEIFDGGERRIEVSGVSLDVVGTLPINQYFSVFARAGVLASKADTKHSWLKETVATTPNIIPIYFEFYAIPRRANTFEYGFGLEYNVNSRWSIESEWQRVNMGIYQMGYLDTLDVGVIFKF